MTTLYGLYLYLYFVLIDKTTVSSVKWRYHSKYVNPIKYDLGNNARIRRPLLASSRA